MQKVIKFIKKNVYKILGTLLITTFIVIFGILIFSLVYSEDPSSLYGTRLSDINSHPLKSEQLVLLKETIVKDTKINSFTYSIRGRIINFMIVVEDKTLLTYAKDLDKLIIDSFKNEELKYYDAQIFLKSINEEDTNYPTIGYKHHTSLDFVWVNE